jgi:dual-specificity kinase
MRRLRADDDVDKPPGQHKATADDVTTQMWNETERITRSPRTTGAVSSRAESRDSGSRVRRTALKGANAGASYGPGTGQQTRYYTRARSREANSLAAEATFTGSSLTVYSSGEGSVNQLTATASGSGVGSGSGQGSGANSGQGSGADSGSGSGAGGTGSSSISNDATGCSRSGSGGSAGSQGRGDHGTEDTPVSMQRAHSTEGYLHRVPSNGRPRNLAEQMELVERPDTSALQLRGPRTDALPIGSPAQLQLQANLREQANPNATAVEPAPLDTMQRRAAAFAQPECTNTSRQAQQQGFARSRRCVFSDASSGRMQFPSDVSAGAQHASGMHGHHGIASQALAQAAPAVAVTEAQRLRALSSMDAHESLPSWRAATPRAPDAQTVLSAETRTAADECVSVSTSSFERQRESALENPPPSPLMMIAAQVVAPRLPPDLGLALQPDDPNGHVQYSVGEGLGPTADFPNGRYQILAPLGSGTFGKVVSCWDRVTEQLVAVKVIRAVRKYAEAARMEIDILLELGRKDPTSRFHCVRMLSYFTHVSQQGNAHVCLVFEHLGPSLFDVLMRNHFRPLPVPILRAVARQLLEAITFLHEHNQIVHTDIKPENVLIVPSSYYPNRQITEHVQVRLIDFGSASRLDKVSVRHAIVSTRHYRAPEIILGTGWSFACDIWSFGALLVECYTGQTLFQSHDDLEHLQLMQKLLQHENGEVIVPPPRPSPSSTSMGSQRRREALKLFRDGRLNWPEGIDEQSANSLARQKSIRRVARMPELHSIFRPEHACLLHLIRCCLTIDPSKRWRPSELLRHPFFMSYSTEATP